HDHRNIRLLQPQFKERPVPQLPDLKILKYTPEHMQPCPESIRPEEQLADKNNDPCFCDLNSPPPPGILPDMTDTQHPDPYRLHGSPQQNQSKIIQTVENIAASGAVPQSVAYPDRKKRHGRCCQHGYVFPQMFSAVLIPFLYNSGHGNRIE